jgi:hypothetical protein
MIYLHIKAAIQSFIFLFLDNFSFFLELLITLVFHLFVSVSFHVRTAIFLKSFNTVFSFAAIMFSEDGAHQKALLSALSFHQPGVSTALGPLGWFLLGSAAQLHPGCLDHS